MTESRNFQELLSELNRIHNIAIGIILVLMSILGLVIWSQTGVSKDLGALSYIFCGTGIIGFYLLLTGLKPKYAISRILERISDCSANDWATIFALMLILALWGMVFTSDGPILDRLFLMLITSPVFIYTYHQFVGIDRLEKIEEENDVKM